LQAALAERSDGSERSEAKVKGGDIALLAQSVASFINSNGVKFDVFKMRVSASKISNFSQI